MREPMNIGRAARIFLDIKNEEVPEEEKLEAINRVCGMETVNGIAKDAMLDVIRFLMNIKGRWFSVTDSLPEPWEPVLIWSKDNRYEIAMYEPYTCGWLSEDVNEGLESYPWWMPLPEPPEEAEKR